MNCNLNNKKRKLGDRDKVDKKSKQRKIQEEVQFVPETANQANVSVFYDENDLWHVETSVIPKIQTPLHKTNRFQTDLDPWVHYLMVHVFFSFQLINQMDFSKGLNFHFEEHNRESATLTYFMAENERIVIPALPESPHCDIIVKFHNYRMTLKCTKKRL